MAYAREFNETAELGFVPLHERDYIIVDRGYASREYVTNFNYILETGDVKNRDQQTLEPDYQIDWQADDAFTQTLNEIRENVIEAVNNSPEMKELLDKPQWDANDRVAWERGVSEIVSAQVDAVPAFDTYRTTSYKKDENGNFVKDDNGILVAAEDNKYTRNANANAISEDIENGTKNIEFDCELTSIVEGVTLQAVENALLPPDAASGDMKVAGSYFYATGGVSGGNFEAVLGDRIGGHAYVVSPMGNIIEATNDPDGGNVSRAYLESGNDYSLDRLVAGQNFVAKTGAVYGVWGDLEQHASDRAEFTNNREADNASRSALREEITVPAAEVRQMIDEAGVYALEAEDIGVNIYISQADDNTWNITTRQRFDRDGMEDRYVTRYAESYTIPEAGELLPERMQLQDDLRGTVYEFEIGMNDRNEPIISIYEDGEAIERSANQSYVHQLSATIGDTVQGLREGYASLTQDFNAAVENRMNEIKAEYGSFFSSLLDHEEAIIVDRTVLPQNDIEPSAIEVLQDKLGVELTGEWNDQTNDAMARVIAEVQLSDEYKQAVVDEYFSHITDPDEIKRIKSGIETKPDMMPGPATLAAMKELGMDPEMIEATEKLMLMDHDQGNDLYQVPENSLQLLREAQEKIDQTMQATPSPQSAPTNAATLGI